MRFIGQSHIMRQLGFILRTLYSNPGKGAGILLVGPSGYGKTTMGIGIAEYLVGKDFEFYNGEQDKFALKKRVIFIDEIHKMQNCEILYPVFDAGNHVIILATNLNGGLPEALVNRCYEFIFDDYDDDELLLMARESSTFSASDESFMEIVEAGNRNPRIIKKLVDRFGMYFEQNPNINSNSANFIEILENVFSIKDGMDTLCRRYMEVLEQVGGNSSISLLKNILHVDEPTLRNLVEPVLLRKGLIKITQKGRTLS